GEAGAQDLGAGAGPVRVGREPLRVDVPPQLLDGLGGRAGGGEDGPGAGRDGQRRGALRGLRRPDHPVVVVECGALGAARVQVVADGDDARGSWSDSFSRRSDRCGSMPRTKSMIAWFGPECTRGTRALRPTTVKSGRSTTR